MSPVIFSAKKNAYRRHSPRSTFSGQGSLSIDAMMRFVLIVFSLSKLYGPYKLFYATEDGLLSVSKFIENDPVKVSRANHILNYKAPK